MRERQRLERNAASIVLVALALLGVGSSCTPETRYRVASTLFDGVPPPGAREVEKPAREQPPSTPVVTPPTPADAATPAQPLARAEPQRARPKPGAATRDDLPRDATGDIDWVLAASSGQLSPLASADGSIEPMQPLRLDIHLDPGIPGFQVVFPHEPHTFWLRCDNCHPQIFTMKAGANPITMGAIFQGEYCGRCHGKVAFSPVNSCQRCHPRFGAPG